MLQNKQASSLRRIMLAGFVGLSIGILGIALNFVTGDSFARWVLAGSDWWMLSEDGPKLGRRKNTSPVVAVTYGTSSALELNTAPTLETDRKLYQNLLDAGVAVIADTRTLVATSEEEFDSTVKPYLDLVLEFHQSGKAISRNCMFGSVVPIEKIEPYQQVIIHDIIDMHGPALPVLHSRIYPLVDFDFMRFRESMAVWAARNYLQLPAINTDQLLTSLRESGLNAIWLEQHPRLTEHLGDIPELPKRGPYPLGDLDLNWVEFEGSYPTICPAGVFIDYSLSPSEQVHVAYSQVVMRADSLPPKRGSIAVVGLEHDFIPSSSRFSIPTQDENTGQVEVLSTAISTILKNRAMRVLPPWVTWLSMLLLCPLISIVIDTWRLPWAVIGGFSIIAVYFAVAVMAYRSTWLADMTVVPFVLLISGIGGGVARYVAEVRWRSRITDMFGRYVPRAVVSQLIQQSDLQSLAIGGKTREVTVMFADVRGFTSYSEGMPPEEVLAELNQLLKIMVDITFAHEGTVDKFIGDAILVLFNAPLDQPDHTRRAAQAAWEIQQGIEQHNSGLRIGIGIHTGEAIVGNVGTPLRMEYTAIGSTVNIASRLCDSAKAGQVVLSESASASITDLFELSPAETIRVKGIEAELRVSRLKGRLIDAIDH